MVSSKQQSILYLTVKQQNLSLMKKILSMAVAAMILTSCATYEGCPSYGNSNKITKHGSRAQAKYIKRHI